jgi:hypothetical protein
MELLIFGTLIVALLVCGYVIRNLMKKVEVLEDNIESLETDFIEYNNFFEDIKKHATLSYNRMKQIDRLGAFESEDEAGTTFQLLNQVITELKEQFDGSEA